MPPFVASEFSVYLLVAFRKTTLAVVPIPPSLLQKEMEPFDLPVLYNGTELLFPAHLQQTGFSHRILVEINGTEVSFEPDEERNYRAVVDPEKLNKTPDAGLLKAVAESIEAIVK